MQGVNLVSAVFDREGCIRELAHRMWLSGSGFSAEQDWLIAESIVLATQLKVIITHRDVLRVDKSKQVSDIDYTGKEPVITDKQGSLIQLTRQTLSAPDYIVGIEASPHKQ